MKALTLYQPWAQLVAIGAKRIETRSWGTSYRGPLAIHAGKAMKTEAMRLILINPFRTCIGQNKLSFGCIVATCELVDVMQVGEWDASGIEIDYFNQGHRWSLTHQEQAFGNYAIGRYMWFLDNIKILPELIPAKGAQRLWEWKIPEPKLTIFNKDGSKTEVTPLKIWDPGELSDTL